MIFLPYLGKQQRTSSALFIFEKRVDICGSYKQYFTVDFFCSSYTLGLFKEALVAVDSANYFYFVFLSFIHLLLNRIFVDFF